MSSPDVASLAQNHIYSDQATRRAGYLILLLVFGIFGTWSTLAPLDSAALASGVVMVKSYRKTVQHLEGGIVRELHVRDGDPVKKGATLLTLDATAAQAELEVLRNQLLANAALEARLLAELNDAKELPLPEIPANSPRALEAWQTEQALFTARYRAREGEIEILRSSASQLNTQIQGLETVIRSKQLLEQSHNEEANDLRALLKEGFTDKQRLREQERNLARLAAEIADHRSSIAQARLRSSEISLQILQLKKQSSHEGTTQLGEAQRQSFDLRERISSLEERLQRTQISAPESGMVLGMRVHTLGAVISAGMPILDIVPSDAELVIEARISPNDIDRVSLGSPADIRFSAFKSSTTPVIEGVLEYLSADSLIDEQSGHTYYLGRIAITENGMRQLDRLTLQPGMPAEVLINTGSRTLLSYLTQPASNWAARSMTED